MKKLIALIFLANVCFATDTPSMFGTTDNPQINGHSGYAYDVHKPYIEPNQGYAVATQNSQGSSNEPAQQEGKKIVVKTATAPVKTPVNFKTDSFADDSKIKKILKNAASEGKLNYVLEQADKAKVPATVALLPIVESNYNKNAISPKGAGGAWQLMTGTANDYGLSSEGRFDFNSSTKVAIDLLKDLHNTFGNWPLAFAAYNCGTQCVINALKKNPNAKDIDELSLPRETKDYVHKIVWYGQLIAGLDKTETTVKN